MKSEAAVKQRWWTMTRRESLHGFLFTTPFIIGLIVFFIYPLYISFKLSFGTLDNIVGMKVSWAGLVNYKEVLARDVEFLPMVGRTFLGILTNVPLIVVFSFVIAVMLTKKVKGNWFFRSAFFIPFLLGSGYVMEQLLQQGVNTNVLNLDMAIIIPQSAIWYLGSDIVTMVNNFLGNVVNLLWRSSVQIILFISGLHAIPSSCYEAARVEGANEWETFWKITIPMVSPITFLNIVYTIIISFTDINNEVLQYIKGKIFRGSQLNFEYGSARYWIYTVVIFAVVGIVFAILGRTVKVKGGKQ